MPRRILCGVLATLFLLTGVAVYAETMQDIQAHKNCKYCGMDREKFAHSRMLTSIAMAPASVPAASTARPSIWRKPLISSPKPLWWRITTRKI